MARADDTQLIDSFEEFYRSYYQEEIAELAQKYPSEQKSLFIDWQQLYKFDADLADDFRTKPKQIQQYAEEALRLYDLPVDVSLGQAHVRVTNLPESTDIRQIRADHRGQLIKVQGIIRKVTDVRPKITVAAFECQRCGTLTRIPQEGGDFQEPHECQGCERQGPFRINYDQSEFIDAQKLRVQESPEGLRGGETPQSIDINVEDDITGEVTAGDHVSVIGILELDQRGNDREKSPMFDVYMDGLAVDIEDEQFEEMDISDADKTEIIELSNQPDIYERMRDSIAPSIYGYEKEKLAMVFQLFSGVTKHLPDGSRTRGDLHMLLIGDPGTGKSAMLQYVDNIAPRSVYTSGKGASAAGLCVTGDTLVHTEDGFQPIRDIVEPAIPDPVSAKTAVAEEIQLYTYDRDCGRLDTRSTSHLWRMPEKSCRRITTNHGKDLEASVNTPVLTCGETGLEWKPIREVEAGEYVAIPDYDHASTAIDRSPVEVCELLELTSEKVKLAPDSVTFLREALCETYGTLRNAASALSLSEDFVYDSLSNRYLPLDKLDRMLDAIDAERVDVDIDRVMIRHGDSIAIPDVFDEDLMYLLGLVFGDGDIRLDRRDGNRGCVRISNSDEKLLERAKGIIDAKFDKDVSIEYQDDKVPCIRLHSATIARLFSIAGMARPKDSLALNSRLTTAEHADAFLRGLMDTDGAVSVRDAGGSSVLLSTISETFAEQIQLMLETYGIRASCRERDRRGTYELDSGYTIESKHIQHFVEIFGADIDRFAAAIGFEQPEKQTQLAAIVETETRTEEMVPVGTALATASASSSKYWTNLTRGSNPGRGRARAILEEVDLGDAERHIEEAVEAGLVWDEVVKAEDTGEKEVFDLTVPDTHNFIGNGIVTHNTAAAVRDDFGDGQQWSLEAGALVLADQGIAAVDELDKMRCVTGDTLVQTSAGIVPIETIATNVAATGDIEEHDHGRTIRDLDLRVWTMTEDNQVVQRPVTALHEYPAPETVTSVTLESGESLTATPDHPFFVFEDGERVEKPAAELQEDDWVYVPDSLQPSRTDGGTESLAQVDENENGFDSNIAAILGYLCGDGNIYYKRDWGSYGIRFTNKEEELLEHFEEVAGNAFGIAAPSRYPSEQRDDGVGTVRVHGKTVADKLIDYGLNIETFDGKRVPQAVREGTPNEKAAFIRALADSEAHVGKRNVKISSSSYDLLLGTKLLLAEFGISSQIQHRERDGKRRDLYILAITSDESLSAFADHIGFTLERKQRALNVACDQTTGTRTIIDVIPECGNILGQLRTELRLHQAECGLHDATYCNFENGDANISFDAAEAVLNAFENRLAAAEQDLERIGDIASWDELAALKERYHVSQSELANGTSYSQTQISANWGDSSDLKAVIHHRVREILTDITGTDISTFRSLVRGGVKWRRVSSIEQTTPDENDAKSRLLKLELAELLDCPTDNAQQYAKAVLDQPPTATDWRELREELERHNLSFQALGDHMDVDGSTISRWFNQVVDGESFETVKTAGFELIDHRRSAVQELVEQIDWNTQPKVYDLTVEGTHNFVGNGIVIHNSEDQSAMHQALEQQSISVSKAGINATLKSRCSLLGAANPIMGRFDKYEPIGEQIDLEPPLISRFDLIFTVTDQPDKEKDTELAEHILQTNYAGELNTHRINTTTSNYSEAEVENVTEEVAPEIDADLLRKYIAYSRRNCYPTMTEEAKDAIQKFYVDLRARGIDEDAPVPVTARKLEALVRLAEASARVRLSDTVELEDARRGIDIAEYCLREIGMDPETGELDADMIETGTTKSQRDRIKNLKHLIETIEDEYDEGAPIDIIIERAEEEGIDREKAEHEIEKLKQKGEVYEPQTDHLRTT